MPRNPDVHRKWVKDHPENIKAINHRNYENHKELRKADGKRYRKEHPELPEKSHDRYIRNYIKLKLDVLSHYSPDGIRCAICGESYLEFLGIDHVNGGGNRHRKKHGSNIYRWLKNSSFPDGYRVLCHNCNQEVGHPVKNTRSTRYTMRAKLIVFEHYCGGNPRCMCDGCNESNIRHLCIDHINGNGVQHRKEVGSHLYDWLIKNNFPEGFRVLCHNCNQSLGYSGYCPHNQQPKQTVQVSVGGIV